MTVRILIAAVCLLAIHEMAELLKGRGMPTEPAPLDLRLEEMPLSFDAWTGKDIPLDPHVFQAIGAEMAVNRRYQNRSAAVDLHSDVFTTYGIRVLHPPELCYSSNGFLVEGGETMEISGKDKKAHAARFLTMTRNDQHVYCLYWYQVGDKTFWNGDDQRRVVQSFRGQKFWPPMIKVMLEISANSPDEAQKQLKPLAEPVYDWVCNYH